MAKVTHIGVLREPLLHFVLVGIILFGGYTWLQGNRSETAALAPISISQGDIRWLKQTWSGQWLREPTAAELKGLVDELVEEKLLAREAEAMGLGQDDTIIRRRLAQKLNFLVEDTAQLAEPSEAELHQFYTANASRFETAGRVSFKHVYFNPERRPRATDDAKLALAQLDQDPQFEAGAGDRQLLGDSFADIEETTLSSLFGAEFAHQVFALETGRWQGPLQSGYGLHLVFVTQRTPPAARPFEAVKSAVLAEWRRARQSEVNQAYLIAMRRKYGVEWDDGVAAALGSAVPPKVVEK